MNATHPSTLVAEVPGYAELQREMHDVLCAQHPHWIAEDGNSPTCDSYEGRFAELLVKSRGQKSAITDQICVSAKTVRTFSLSGAPAFAEATAWQATQEKLASEIIRFGSRKAVDDKKVPDPLGSAVFVLQKLFVRPFHAQQAHLPDAASFAHCQNFSLAGLSGPFRATMPTEIAFGSGVMCKSFTRFPKL
jgi:hypothetical protein